MKHPTPWQLGNKSKAAPFVYDAAGNHVCWAMNPQLAQRIVDAVNQVAKAEALVERVAPSGKKKGA